MAENIKMYLGMFGMGLTLALCFAIGNGTFF